MAARSSQLCRSRTACGCWCYTGIKPLTLLLLRAAVLHELSTISTYCILQHQVNTFHPIDQPQLAQLRTPIPASQRAPWHSVVTSIHRAVTHLGCHMALTQLLPDVVRDRSN